MKTHPHDEQDGGPLQAEDLGRLYRARFDGKRAYRDRVWRVLAREYFVRWIQPTDSVLDMGAGHGEFINNVQCGKKYALDLNPDTARKANADVEVIHSDCSAPWPLPDESLDIVFTSNFLEHLPNKAALSRALTQAYRCLKLGGRLIAMGPNIRFLSGAYWDFIDHHLPLSERSLSEALAHAGFRVEARVPKFLPFTMVGGPEYPLVFLRVYLSIPLAWRIFGKQFLVIGRKESL